MYIEKELDNETSYKYFGARYYDSELSGWLSVDTNGKEIRICCGLAFLGKQKYITYTPRMQYNGKNKFVRDVINSLNYIYSNADIQGIIQKLSNTSEIVEIAYGYYKYYNVEDRRIYFNIKGLEVYFINNGIIDTGKQFGALGLFHELGHTFRDIFKHNEFNNDINIKDNEYDNIEERRVIEDYKTPAAIILNEGIRNNHKGKPFNTIDPRTTKTNEEHRNEYKCHVPML
ncbi:MAG: hypothetical protein PHF55_01100 [Bacteroidales bacterium]|nr:hypothetical protein [Bacteroidales bacterium]